MVIDLMASPTLRASTTLHAAHDPPEDRVLPVELVRGCERDVELRAGGVRVGRARHRDDAAVVLDVVELGLLGPPRGTGTELRIGLKGGRGLLALDDARDLRRGQLPRGRISRLHDEAGLDAVDADAVVELRLHEFEEGRDRVGRLVRIQLHLEGALVRLDDDMLFPGRLVGGHVESLIGRRGRLGVPGGGRLGTRGRRSARAGAAGEHADGERERRERGEKAVPRHRRHILAGPSDTLPHACPDHAGALSRAHTRGASVTGCARMACGAHDMPRRSRGHVGPRAYDSPGGDERMGAPGTDKVRNVVLVGHGGAGKTSLAEAMLFMAGETKRLGTVDDGHSTLDYDPEELKRTMTVNLSLAPWSHNDVKINVIDTPGFADFMGDAIAGMEAAEMALFVVDAVSGPQVQTERLWEARRRDGHRPRGVRQPHGQGARRLRRGHGQARRLVRPPRRRRPDTDGRGSRLPAASSTSSA